jgi:hypothetical protein
MHQHRQSKSHKPIATLISSAGWAGIDGTYTGQPTMRRLNRLQNADIYLTLTTRLKYSLVAAALTTAILGVDTASVRPHAFSGAPTRSTRGYLRHFPRAIGREGRLHLIADVLARPGPVLSRSNRVLTLRRILRCTTAKSGHLAELVPSGRNRPCTPNSPSPS